MDRVVVTGAAGATGSRLVALLVAGGREVVAIDREDPDDPVAAAGGAPPALPGSVRHVRGDLRALQLKPLCEGAAAVVHLAWEPGRAGIDATAAVLDAAGDAAAPLVVHRSSGVVYGAWPDNPVPLTEDATLRPNPGFGPAADHAEGERLVAEWADAHPAAATVVLRPALTLAPGAPGLLASRLGPDGPRPPEPPPAQFLGADDLAAAAAHAVEARLAGVFNVAPDGWVPGDTLRELVGRSLVPYRMRGGGPAAPWREHPWVIANDRLKATGWSPTATSEEVVVAVRRGSWWRELSPERRQQLTLGASAGLLAGVAGAVAAVARSVIRRR